MRWVVAGTWAAPFLLTAAWCRATSSAYRHVRVIPAPYDWEERGWL